jgi:quinol monooxygenase YgiN
VTLLVLGAFTAFAPSYQSQQPPAQPSAPAAQPPPQADGIQNLGMALVQGLQATEGCLGVELAQTVSGKNVIFAWFEDKAAVKRWYYSDTHVAAMKRFFPDGQPGAPLAGVPDDVKPIMCIASITPATEAQLKQTTLPISQIAIELYTPVTGGIFLGSRFAPNEMEVKGMDDYTPPAMRAPAEGANP